MNLEKIIQKKGSQSRLLSAISIIRCLFFFNCFICYNLPSKNIMDYGLYAILKYILTLELFVIKYYSKSLYF